MSLHIECENGHKIVCPDSLAGTSVICPKCGSRVDVSARNLAKGGHAFSEVAAASVSGVFKGVTAIAAAGVPAPASPKTDEIAFTCPNGHRLTGPRSLQGQSGECPKCKARFQVPLSGPQAPPGGKAPGTGPARPGERHAAERAPAGDDDISLEEIEEIDLPSFVASRLPRDAPTVAADLARGETPESAEQLFAMLWSERQHGGTVELQLDDGSILVPDWWSERWSTASHGVFAVQKGAKTYEIQAIAWPHIRRISVRGLTALPGEMFDETAAPRAMSAE